MGVAQIEEEWHDEQLMEALVAAAQVVPRGPPESATSAAAILARWRARAGVGLATEEGNVLGSGAWEVGEIVPSPFIRDLGRRSLFARMK